MSFINQFDKYRKQRKEYEGSKTQILESVIEQGDSYEVNLSVDFPKSLLNSYIKKVKDDLNIKTSTYYSEIVLIEKILKNVIKKGLVLENLDPKDLFGSNKGQQSSQVQDQNNQNQTEEKIEKPEAVETNDNKPNEEGVEVKIDNSFEETKLPNEQA